ncbi:VOC family protein [Amnibacterium endophyticum]|uniref:VOC family protein n=1 Tax=Amnibacterium endophyticum TaxID=2109337 RepID=A0ABW4LE24_9MICO
MRIQTVSVFVDDQQRALDFYTGVLGFVVAADVPLGEHRWLTVASPEQPDGTQLSLEPKAHPAVPPFTSALVRDGIPFLQLEVDDVQAEYDRLRAAGVTFVQPPTAMGPVTTAVLDDTCGNLLQLARLTDS